MAKRPQNLPAFNRAELEAINKRLSKIVPVQSRQMIMASLNTASNPQAETAEYGMASLPQSRKRIAEQSAQETGQVFSFTNNVIIPFGVQNDYNEALGQAQTDNTPLEWAVVLALLVYFLFPKEQEEIQQDSIFNAYISAYKLALQEQASRYGCPYAKIGNPTASSMKQMETWAKRDAESIAKTYNREAESALRNLYEATPLGAINYYLEGMAQWASTRQQRKNLTIGINNVQAGYQLGLEDFHTHNSLQTKYRFMGASPICPTCIGLFSLGHVDFDTVLNNAAPVHANCPHYWESVRTYQIDCASIWVGV